MENGHLTYEELERYIEDTDLSEEYLCFCEPIIAHLDSCSLCRDRIEKMLFLSQLLEETQLIPAINLVQKEEKIRRNILALRLEMMAQEKRMQDVAMRLKMGMLLQVSIAKADFGRQMAVTRSESETEQKPVNVYYENGKAYVAVAAEMNTEVTVILTPVKEKAAEILVAEAPWDETRRQFIAEFAIEQLEDYYEIYVDKK